MHIDSSLFLIFLEQRFRVGVIAAVPQIRGNEMTPQISMATNFYYLSEQPNGLWAVKETVSQQPVSLNGQLCCSLRKRDAEELIEYLNSLDASLAA
jgi:hypothetical protein